MTEPIINLEIKSNFLFGIKISLNEKKMPLPQAAQLEMESEAFQ
jgi:hypothetical protein